MAENSNKALGYRAEIDGLRAIAVLAVVLFHARLGVLGGGYAGVDVFFVISGFLISRLIAEEYARSGRFSLLGFYERRIRRLLPALGVVVLACVIVGWLQLAPSDFLMLTRSVMATLAFFSNLYFAKQVGYFQPAAETQPLLHTWSLGVEEQFYILAPFVVLGLLKLPFRARQAGAGLLCLVSLVIAVAQPPNLRETAFFWPHVRAYELLIGVILGLRLVPLPQSEVARGRLAVAGLALVALALVFLPPAVFYPSALALLPCLGTAMVIAASEGGAIPGVSGALLSAAPMRFFGRISYSLYLWHWPVLAYAVLITEDSLLGWQRVGLMVLAVGLSWLSFRFVETPARHGAVRRKLAFVFAPALVLVAAGFGLSTLSDARHGFPGRFGEAMARVLEGMNQPKWPDPVCDAEGRCFIGAEKGPVRHFLWGDSHAEMLGPELGEQARRKGTRVGIAISSGCPPLLKRDGQHVIARPVCQFQAMQALRALAENPGLEVMISSRWAYYAEALELGPVARNRPAQPLVPGGVEANRAAFQAALLDTVAAFQARGARVRLIGPMPEFTQNITQMASRRVITGAPLQASVSMVDVETRQRAVRAAFEAARQAGATLSDPLPNLCDARECLAVRDGVPLYKDNNHLSARGVSLLAPFLAQLLAAP